MFENPDILSGAISLFFINLAKKKIPENKKIKGDIFIKIDGSLFNDNIKVWIKKLPDNAFSLKNIISSKYVDNVIKEKKIEKKINKERENSLSKYLIIILGVYLFIVSIENIFF